MLNEPTMAQLVEAMKERPIRMSVPLPTATVLEDTEVIRAYVNSMIEQAIAEWFDHGLEQGADA